MLSIGKFLKDQLNHIELLDSELILAHATGKSREWVIAHPEEQLDDQQARKARSWAKRRAAGCPLAYLTGRKWFYGREFIVNKHVLIPRPETELMVEEALQQLTRNTQQLTRNTEADEVFYVDIGTGSGCLPITIVNELKEKKHTKKSRVYATDVSPEAINVAKKNAKKHGDPHDILFRQGDLLEPIINRQDRHAACCVLRATRIIITANLPYLTPRQIKDSPSIQAEPRLALDGGADGLKYYRRLFGQIDNHLLKDLKITESARQKTKTSTQHATHDALHACPEQCRRVPRYALHLLCEIDPSQKNSIKKLARNFFPSAQIEIKKDLRGHCRLAIITI